MATQHLRHHCGRCHECGLPLRKVLDGEEYCAQCHAYQRYVSHGWTGNALDDYRDECPPPADCYEPPAHDDDFYDRLGNQG